MDGSHGRSLRIARPGRAAPIYTVAMKLLVPALLLAAVLAAAALLGGGSSRADFTFVQPSDAFTLDPQRMTYQHDIRLGRSIHETLVAVDPRPGQFRPGVAESWELSPDGRTWTFRLRADARWSNGDPVTAGDFVAGWRRAMLPDVASDYAGFLEEVDGARELWAFRAVQLKAHAALPADERTAARAEAAWRECEEFAARTVRAEALDDRTLRVTLRDRVPYFLSLAAFPVMSPVHRPTLERFSSFDAESGRRVTDPRWTRPGNLVSNGRYSVEEWRFRRRMRLVRNPMHWDRASEAVATIDIVPMADPNTAVLAFESGAADWLESVRVGYKPELVAQSRAYLARHRARYDELLASGASVDEALAALPAPAANERRDVHLVPNFGTDFFSFNCRPTLPGGAPNPFAIPGVRRAFALAVDKAALAERVIRFGEPPAWCLVPPGSVPGYDSPAGLRLDADRARRELAEAGWKDRDGDGAPEDAQGKPFPTVEILHPSDNPRYRDLSLALRDMWRRELGVGVELRSKDPKAAKDDLQKGNFMVARGGWYGDYDDPRTFLELSRSTDGNNDRGYSCAEYDALLDRAAAEADPAARLRTLAEAERMIMERDMPILPIAHYATVLMFDPARVRGITRDPSFDQMLSDVRVLAPR
jgi:oligopeptide transport system substrate-binding protein